MYLSIYLSISLSLSVYLSTCLSASLKTKLSCETSSGFELDNIKNAAILRDVLNVWSWQRQKRSNSARHPQFLNLTTSETNFDVDNIKNESILRDFLQKWEVECRADGLVPMCFAIFPVHLSKLLRLPRKSDARSYEVLRLSRKIISANLKIWCSKMQPLLGNQRPDLLTALMKMSLVLRLPRKRHLCRSSANVPRLPWSLEMLQNLHVLLTFDKVHNPLRLPRETTSERPKVVRPPGVFNILTSKCALRHNSVHFFQLPKVVRAWCALYILTSKLCFAPQQRALLDISTSKSGPRMVCCVHFDFEMCFAPQRRALFRHLNFQKRSEREVFLAFSLANVLRAPTACTFSSLIWPDGSAPAALASLLFDPPEPQIIGKTQCFATFLPFRASELLSSDIFWLFLFSDLLSSTLLFSLTLPVSAFHLSILSEVWLLNFLRLSPNISNRYFFKWSSKSPKQDICHH